MEILFSELHHRPLNICHIIDFTMFTTGKLGLEMCDEVEDQCYKTMHCASGMCKCMYGRMTPDHTFCLGRYQVLLGDKCSHSTHCFHKSRKSRHYTMFASSGQDFFRSMLITIFFELIGRNKHDKHLTNRP